jgi:hypothetical protein
VNVLKKPHQLSLSVENSQNQTIQLFLTRTKFLIQSICGSIIEANVADQNEGNSNVDADIGGEWPFKFSDLNPFSHLLVGLRHSTNFV